MFWVKTGLRRAFKWTSGQIKKKFIVGNLKWLSILKDALMVDTSLFLDLLDLLKC